MIATDRFVFLHLHKSGGSFVNEALLRFAPDAVAIGYHLPRRLTPPQHARKPALGLVRNPWSYYVSWYAFQSGRPTQNALFRVLSEEGRHGFEGTIRNMLSLHQGGDLLDAVLAALPGSYGGTGLNLPRPSLAPIRGSGVGFYSFLHDYMYSPAAPDAPATRVARMEQMRQEMPALMREVGFAPPALLQFFDQRPPANVSSHGPHREYYSPALRDLVAVSDAALIGRYGYEF